MKWILLGFLLLLVLGGVTLAVNLLRGAWSFTRFMTDGRRPRWSTPPPQARCLTCQGTGWTNREPERTFAFDSDGFEDRHQPATICAACAGTGMAPVRRVT